MENIIDHSNMYFDEHVDKLEVGLARCVNILRKLSKSSEKHWKQIRDFSTKMNEDRTVELDIDLEVEEKDDEK